MNSANFFFNSDKEVSISSFSCVRGGILTGLNDTRKGSPVRLID